MMRLACLATLLAGCLYLPHASAHSGVILLYHHVSASTPTSTSVTPATFEAHLDYLAQHAITVWDLRRMLDAIYGGEQLPDNVVAITFDDAYESVYTTAWPRLRAHNRPFTVFVNTDAVDAGLAPYMSWAQLRELAADGVAIENHSASHGHLARMESGESVADWQRRVAQDLARGRARIEAEIGRPPELLAWPYGEDAQELWPMAARAHRYSLAQRSGAVGPHHPRHSIPRFPLAMGFDTRERLAVAIHSRALPVGRATTEPPVRRGAVMHPQRLRLVLLAEEGWRAAQVDCFAASGERLSTRFAERRLDILLPTARPGRNKINCTAPATDGSGDYYWYSFQWLQRREDGAWPAE